jgi:hypothetical protein
MSATERDLRQANDKLELWKATAKGLFVELALLEQTMGELCESCGWSMRLPDQPCRCELERELAAAKDALLKAHKDYGCELRDPNGTIWEHAAKVQQQRDTLANHVHALAHLLAAANQQFLHSAAVTQDIQDALAAVKGGTP